MSFRKLLIANRGEIACRVISTARALGYPTVAVYSDADADARHVAMADEAVRIGPPAAAQSYLDIEAILAACARTGADAIHPGYGFLSENAGFARACEEAGITFVGPTPAAIEVMGDKASAKAALRDAAVPLVPGFFSDDPADQADERLMAEAERVGYPLLVKAVAGGGGRGMRRVHQASELAAAIQSARGEAKSAFGDDALMLERLVTGARHVEIQVFADTQGNAVHLGERDCSLQRRHQKVVEEAPSPFVDAELRAAMGEAAVAAAKAIGYRGAGTVEFLVDADRNFYFLEMNTRLQVEHPVTELVTDLDLVELQLEIAAGRPLPFGQDDVILIGHAIEARLYAEDAHAGFMPQTGPVLAWDPAEGEGVRVDHGLRIDQRVTAHYDAMVAKVIAYGRDREQARRRLMLALRDTVALGFVHNKRFLIDVMAGEKFVGGEVTTDWLDSLSPDEAPLARPPLDPRAVAIAVALLAPHASRGPRDEDMFGAAWRNAHTASVPVDLAHGDGVLACSVAFGEDGDEICVPEAEPMRVAILERVDARTRVEIDGHRFEIHAALDESGELHLEFEGLVERFALHLPSGKAKGAPGSDGRIMAPSSGKVLAVLVEPGQAVEAGTALLKLEAMKIESTLCTPVAGTVREVRVQAGDQVEQRALLVVIETAESDTAES